MTNSLKLVDFSPVSSCYVFLVRRLENVFENDFDSAGSRVDNFCCGNRMLPLLLKSLLPEAGFLLPILTQGV